jgi:integrase
VNLSSAQRVRRQRRLPAVRRIIHSGGGDMRPARNRQPAGWQSTRTAPLYGPRPTPSHSPSTARQRGVPVIRLHDVRHTTAGMLLDGGTTPPAAAKWLGHDPAITLRVYGHVYDDALATAGDALLGRSRATDGHLN